MALFYGSKIVTDNLNLCLDAASPRSYTGSSTWRDLSGKGNHGTINGTTFSSQGGGSLLLNGTSDHIVVPNSSTIQSNANITFEMLMKFNSLTNETVAISLFNKRTNSSTNPEYFIFILNSGGDDFTFDFAASADRWSTGYIPVTSTWYHLVFTRNASGRNFYLNGQFQGSSTAGTVNTSTNDLYIGKSEAANTQYYLSGNIGFVRIYHKTLSSREVKQNYLASRGRFA